MPSSGVIRKDSRSQSVDESKDQCDAPDVTRKAETLPANLRSSQIKYSQDKQEATLVADQQTVEVVNESGTDTTQTST